jgi:hypothetical protein
VLWPFLWVFTSGNFKVCFLDLSCQTVCM